MGFRFEGVLLSSLWNKKISANILIGNAGFSVVEADQVPLVAKQNNDFFTTRMVANLPDGCRVDFVSLGVFEL